MAQQTANLQSFTNELVKHIEELREQRKEMDDSIRQEEATKRELQVQAAALEHKIVALDESLEHMAQRRDEIDTTLREADEAFAKIIESTQSLLHFVKRGE
eukprot:TRINITY_DN2524_c0_g1_i1.p3 TRINITY_DN2524_c0_g1~~TRINITY_DN2524_c0_g1_i1.p3  ORF type:complete len:101 (+),score=28.63 TRINITY_DN2524_c0_g1_i1:10-312(+)